MLAEVKKIATALILVVMISFSADAQPGSGPGGGTKPGTVPISGIEILLAIGGFVGAKKLLSKKSR